VFAYLAGSKAWMRALVMVCAIPIAIIANALRVAISGWSPALAEGTPHQLAGGAIFLACLAALVLFHRLVTSFHAHPA